MSNVPPCNGFVHAPLLLGQNTTILPLAWVQRELDSIPLYRVIIGMATLVWVYMGLRVNWNVGQPQRLFGAGAVTAAAVANGTECPIQSAAGGTRQPPLISARLLANNPVHGSALRF